MLRRLVLFLALVCAPGDADAAHVNVVTLDNRIISPVTQQYILDALDRSERDGAACLVIVLDTPGGLLDSTRAIVKRMMNARVPVAVYVGPSGSRAGSAGVFITLAAHVAAMAPTTNIGAAHPVAMGDGGGGPVKKLIKRFKRDGEGAPSSEEEVVEEIADDPMAAKVLNDTVAWAVTIAAARGRNAEWAKQAVTESFSVSETEAVDRKIVDFIAADVPALLTQMHGRRVNVAGEEVELKTAGAAMVPIAMSKRQEFLAVITSPTIAYLLMMLGTLGLVFEFTHPGVGFPGIAGLICLVLALYAFQTLPISYAAVALIVLGIILLVAEVKIVSHGLLGIGGVVALTLGSLMLVESPDPSLRVSLQVVSPVVLTLAAIILFVVQRALRAQAQPAATGSAALVGELGVASTDLDPEGMVFVHGELWSASSPRALQQGERVRVLRVDGLRLLVDKIDSPETSKRGRAKAARGKRTAQGGT